MNPVEKIIGPKCPECGNIITDVRHVITAHDVSKNNKVEYKLFKCPNCKKKVKGEYNYANKSIWCPDCKESFEY